MNRNVFIAALAAVVALPLPAAARIINLVQNPGFEDAGPSGDSPAGYDLTGAAKWGRVGGEDEFTTKGVIFPGDAKEGGSVSQVVRSLDAAKGKWLTFRFRGLAEDGFLVDDNALAMKIEFYSKNGTDYLDGVTRLIYREVENDRKDLTINGDYGRHGAAVWRSYELEELIPFPEVDTVRISVIYKDGTSTESEHISFYIDDFSLVQRTESLTGKVDPALTHPENASVPSAAPDMSKLVALGGRWYYEPAPGESVAPSARMKTRTGSSTKATG
jgi:hypothetical protein